VSEPHRHLVLVVDDDADGRQALALFLDAKGYHVQGAADGPDALLLLATGLRPCCVVADLAMPGMDGWTLTERLRAAPACATLPVILYSGYPMRDGDHARSKQLGVSAYILKPA